MCRPVGAGASSTPRCGRRRRTARRASAPAYAHVPGGGCHDDPETPRSGVAPLPHPPDGDDRRHRRAAGRRCPAQRARRRPGGHAAHCPTPRVGLRRGHGPRAGRRVVPGPARPAAYRHHRPGDRAGAGAGVRRGVASDVPYGRRPRPRRTGQRADHHRRRQGRGHPRTGADHRAHDRHAGVEVRQLPGTGRPRLAGRLPTAPQHGLGHAGTDHRRAHLVQCPSTAWPGSAATRA